MRSAMLMAVVLLVLGGLFYFFILSGDRSAIYTAAPTTAPTTQRASATMPTVGAPGGSIVGPSAGVFAQTRNRKTEQVVSEFRAEEFTPRPDGDVDVRRPEARFYGREGGIITLEGTRGKVSLTQPGSRDDPQALGAATPTHGELQDVTIRFYERSLEEEPTIIATVPAVKFDATTNRLSTMDGVIDGKGVLAEQVPVTVRGRDFEFDGQGLTMRWNDREGKLDLLEITRGNRLLMRDLSKLTPPAPASKPTAVGAGAFPGLSPGDVIFGLMMAAPAADAPPAPATAPSAPAAKRELYHATFDRDVHVLQNGVEVASGEVMRVVVPMGNAKEVEAPRPAPERRSRAARARMNAATSRAASQPTASIQPPTPAPARTAPTTAPAPTTLPAGPVEIRWSGKLTVRPVSAVPDAPQTQMVEIVGSPATVQQNGAVAQARLIHIEPDAGRLRIEPGGSVRAIDLRDAGGGHLRSRSALIVDQADGTARIDGGGALVAPPRAPGESPLTITWSRKLEMLLSDDGASHLERIMIEGDANVSSAQFKLTCAALALAFAPPADDGGAPARQSPGEMSMPSPDANLLRGVHAMGNARCTFGAEGASRTLAANDIELGLVGSETGPQMTSALCNGSVALDDGKGFTLACGNLEATLKPTPLDDPSATAGGDPLDAITHLLARENVVSKQADGSGARGDHLELTVGANGARQMVLLGAPAVAATPRGTLEGGRIEVDPATGNVRVPGTGRFASTDAKQPLSTSTIAWTESMQVDATSGVCTLLGGVHIDGSDPKGTTMKARAKNGVVRFSTKPASTTAPAKPPATRPAGMSMPDITVDAIRSVDLTGEVDVNLAEGDVQSVALQTPVLNIDLEAGSVIAPQAGRMLVVDHRKTVEGADQGKSRLGPGTLALMWQERLQWDLRPGTLALTGGVRAGYERDGSDDPIRLTCDRMLGTLTPVETSPGMQQVAQRVDLKTLRAEQDVVVRSKQASFDAVTLSFDVSSNLAHAAGDAGRPVEVYNANGRTQVGFSAITWNLETGLIDDLRDIRGQISR